MITPLSAVVYVCLTLIMDNYIGLLPQLDLSANQLETSDLSVDDDIPVRKDGCKRLFSANVNSLRGKIDAVRSLCLTYHPDVFAIQETKLGPGIDSGELTIPNYRLYRKDRNTNGGGDFKP